MRAGTSRYENKIQPVHFEPVENQHLQFIPEEFRMITNDIIPGIRPYYMISNYGRVWHIYQRKFLIASIDTKGYLFITLSTDYGHITVRIHRMVMLVFSPVPNSKDLLVNHIDGVKTNPYIKNLEWCTVEENQRHAIKNGLKTFERLTEEKVHEICKMLEDPTIPLLTIANKTGASYSVVSKIQQKRAYTDISDSYNITQRKINNNLNMEQIKAICEWFQNNPKNKFETLDMHSAEGLRAIGVNNPTSGEIRTAKKILVRETYQYISKDYMF